MSATTKPYYIGRFAPSPTGNLHLGSLIAAMASYCEALKQNGQWLIRIEDLDPPREIPGSSINIINTLHKLGFEFSQDIVYQSQQSRQIAYQQALQVLTEKKHIYYCCCSRAQLKKTPLYSHECRNNTTIPNQPYSVTLKTPNKVVKFIDAIQGLYAKNLQDDCGDFILRRKDGLFSYQIAVVVDDEFQNISHIVRGIDLIESTPWQLYLNSLLGNKQASYAHIPILVNSQGQKLSKQTYAKEIDNENLLDTLIIAYNYLNQKQLITKPKSVTGFWQQAICNWDINKIAKVNAITV